MSKLLNFNSDIIRDSFSAILKEFGSSLEEAGLDPESVGEIVEEVGKLSMALMDPGLDENTRKAAERALKGIPIRMKQRLVSLEAQTRDKVQHFLGKLVSVVETLAALLFTLV